MGFNIGQKVIVTEDIEVTNQEILKGSTGTIVSIEGSSLGVRWDEPRFLFHDCNGSCEGNHGWYVRDYYFIKGYIKVKRKKGNIDGF